MAKHTTIKHFGKIVKGKRIYYNPELHAESLHALEGKEFEEVIKLRFKKVSNDFHGYYRGGIIGECLDSNIFAGWERNEIHDFFAQMFLTYAKTIKFIGSKGTHYREQVNTISTSSLSSKEMSEFCDKVIQWCAENGIIIHSPEEYLMSKYKTEVKYD